MSEETKTQQPTEKKQQNNRGGRGGKNQDRPRTAKPENKDVDAVEKQTQPNNRGNKNNRGGRGGKNQDRPATATQKESGDVAEEKPRDQESNKNKRGGKRGGDHDGNQVQDKDSWVWKFHNLKRPTYDKVVVTQDTEIPALPTKEEMIRQPQKEHFEEEMKEMDSKISELRTDKTGLIAKRREIMDGGKMQGSSMTYREVLIKKVADLKGFNEKRRQFQNEIKDINSEMDQLDGQKRELLKTLKGGDYSSEEQIKEAIRQLEFKRMNTQFRSATEENKVIKEMDSLKSSIPNAHKLNLIKPKVAELNNKKNETYNELKEVKKDLAVREAEIEGLRKEMEAIKEGQNENKAKGDKVTVEIDACQAKINDLFAKKDRTRDAYFKARYDFECQRDFIYHVNGLQSKKDAINQREIDQAEEKEARAQQIKDLPHPFVKEMDTCVHLIARMHQLKRAAGLEQDDEKAAKDLQQSMIKEQTQQRLANKLQDGKILMMEKQNENELFNNGGKKNKGKKNKAKETSYEADLFAMDIGTVQKFALVNISPPTQPEELQKKQEEIEAKLKWYQDNGESTLQKQIDDLRQAQKEQEEQEKKQLARQQEEEEKEDPAYRPRGGRGRGRGGRNYGDDKRRTATAGRGARTMDNLGPKSEFEGDDDDHYVAPSRPTQAKKTSTQIKTAMELNEDNYPQL